MQIQDYTGLACPEPVIRCRNFIESSDIEFFTAIVDNEPAMENVKRLLEKSSYFTQVENENDKMWKIIAKKDSASIINEEENERAITTKTTSGKTLLIIASEAFGTGDEGLGRKLMGNFLSTMPEFGNELWKIILLNGGVKLSVKEGKPLDALKKFEEEGVEILVCGSCLEFYQLTKEQKVGQSTNMLDVVSAMQLADKIIKI